jgi:hypothetical protein
MFIFCLFISNLASKIFMTSAPGPHSSFINQKQWPTSNELSLVVTCCFIALESRAQSFSIVSFLEDT